MKYKYCLFASILLFSCIKNDKNETVVSNEMKIIELENKIHEITKELEEAETELRKSILQRYRIIEIIGFYELEDPVEKSLLDELMSICQKYNITCIDNEITCKNIINEIAKKGLDNHGLVIIEELNSKLENQKKQFESLLRDKDEKIEELREILSNYRHKK